MPKPTSRPQPPPSPERGLRPAVARVSRPLLEKLHGTRPVVPFLVLLVLLVAGVFTGGVVGAVLIGLVALFVGWLLYLGWPALGGTERLGRLAVLAVAVALCVVQVLPRA